MNPATATNMLGRLSTREQLDSYERLWHTQIYQPSWSELKKEVCILAVNDRIVSVQIFDASPISLRVRSTKGFKQLTAHRGVRPNIYCPSYLEIGRSFIQLSRTNESIAFQ